MHHQSAQNADVVGHCSQKRKKEGMKLGQEGREGGMQGWVTDVCSLLYLRESDASLWPTLKRICNANASAQLPSGWTNLCSTLDVYLLLPSDWRSPLTEQRQERRGVCVCVLNVHIYVCLLCVFAFRSCSTMSFDCIVVAELSEGCSPDSGAGAPVINKPTHYRQLDKRHQLQCINMQLFCKNTNAR